MERTPIKIQYRQDDYFMDIKWVLKAIDKKKIRHNIHCVFADDEFIVGTDGKRLHILRKPEELKDMAGLYTIESNTKNRILLRPFDDDEYYPKYHHIYEAGYADSRLIAIVKSPIECIGELYKEDILINPQYVHDCLAYKSECWVCIDFDNKVEANIYAIDKDRPVVMEFENKKAVIMPLNLNQRR